jgi:hypothetical protein
MARKDKRVTVDATGRDLGKTFVLKEMAATRAEKWAFRAFAALGRSGVQFPENIAALGIAGIATIGLEMLAGIDFVLAEPLLDEMLDCVQIAPDPAHPQIVRPLIEDDVEEIATLLMLRKEVFGLHTDFFTKERLSTLGGSAPPVA